MNSQEKYLEEYEKYKDNHPTIGKEYRVNENAKYVTLLSYDPIEGGEILSSTGLKYTKSAHWCRKYLR